MAIASIVFCIPAAGPTASFLGISMDIPSQVWCHQRDLRPLRAVLGSINGKRQDAASMVSLRNESCVGGCRMMFLIDIQPIYTWYIYIYNYMYIKYIYILVYRVFFCSWILCSCELCFIVQYKPKSGPGGGYIMNSRNCLVDARRDWCFQAWNPPKKVLCEPLVIHHLKHQFSIGFNR